MINFDGVRIFRQSSIQYDSFDNIFNASERMPSVSGVNKKCHTWLFSSRIISLIIVPLTAGCSRLKERKSKKKIAENEENNASSLTKYSEQRHFVNTTVDSNITMDIITSKYKNRIRSKPLTRLKPKPWYPNLNQDLNPNHALPVVNY